METLFNIITDTDILIFHNFFYRDLKDPRENTRLYVIYIGVNILSIITRAYIIIDRNSIKIVVEVVKVYI